MKTDNLTDKLKNAIAILETRQEIAFTELKSECNTALNEIKPTQVVSSLINSISQESQIKSNLLKTAFHLGLGYVFQKFLAKKTNPILTKIINTISNFKFTQ